MSSLSKAGGIGGMGGVEKGKGGFDSVCGHEQKEEGHLEKLVPP
jgi:hypothetical protein